MLNPLSFRSSLAATLALTLLAGCNASQFAGIAKVASKAGGTTGTTTPFVSSATAASLKLTSTTEVTSATDAKALATYDESVVEGASATMEQTESAGTYKVADVDDTATLTAADATATATTTAAAAAPVGAPPPGRPPVLTRAVPQPGAGLDDSEWVDNGGQGGGLLQPAGNQTRGGQPTRGQAPQVGPRPGVAVQVGGQQVSLQPVEAQPQLQGNTRSGGFEMGTFGGGDFDSAQLPCKPVIKNHAPAPARAPKIDVTVVATQRQTAQKQQASFTQANTSASADEQLIAQVLDAQTWATSTDDPTTVTKSGSVTLTVTGGTSRKIAVLRAIQAAAPHALVNGQTDIADVYADGATKTVHWEKTLQADGSYTLAYHHEFVSAKGLKWVSDWTKTIDANGNITGTGTFTATDASGNVTSNEVLNVGGTATAGESITDTTTAVATTTTTTSTTTTTDATATTSATTEAAEEATTTP